MLGLPQGGTMPVLMTMDLPVTRADIEALSDQLNVREDPPGGLIAHIATEREGTVQVVDLWETQADFERFQNERLTPAMDKFMAERGVRLDGPPPEPHFTDAFDLVRGG
jgi:hypothetical protein